MKTNWLHEVCCKIYGSSPPLPPLGFLVCLCDMIRLCLTFSFRTKNEVSALEESILPNK